MITIVIDFIEANWSAFINHCRHNGMEDEKVIEEEIEKLKREA